MTGALGARGSLAALVACATLGLGGAGCSGERLPEWVTFFNRTWVDTEATRREGKEHHFWFQANRWRPEDKNPGPGQGEMATSRSSEFESHFRSGHFHVKSDREIEFVDHLGEYRARVRYRLYACKKGRFDLCADVEGVAPDTRTFYSVRGETLPGPPPDDD